MQNTPDRHPRKIFRATIPAGFPGRIRHNKQVTATRPLQRNLAAAFRIAPNPGCAPGTGAAREQRRSSRNSRKNNGRNSGGSNGRENVRRRITSKNPERHLQSGSSILRDCRKPGRICLQRLLRCKLKQDDDRGFQVRGKNTCLSEAL